jgi:protein with PEP-CTERM/exosortase system signal
VARYLLFHNVMTTAFKYIVSIAALTVALTLSARASFIKDPDPGGVKIFFDKANKNVSDFEGFVGANNSGAPHVHIHTDGNVDTGSGFSNIKPVSGGTLTQLIFTPADPNLFSDFSFRGQLEDGAGGTVTLTVQDNQGNPAQTFTFTGLGGPNDFARQGIISLDGETIKSVTITSNFKEFKQVEISFGQGVPDGGATVMLLGAALTTLGMARRFFKR